MKQAASEARSALEPGGRRFGWNAREARLLALDPLGAIVPGGCACCSSPASSSRVEQRASDGQSLIVPYCDGCQLHASVPVTRSLAATLASLITAVTLTLALPLAWEGSPLWPFVMVVALSCLIPVALIAAWTPKIAPGHSAAGRAAWWTAQGELACTNGHWAAELARSAGIDARLGTARERVLSPWAFAGPILALIAAPIVHRFHHPLVRVVNLTETRVEVFVDGERHASVDPTSAESPAAGVEIRVPSGKRELYVLAADGRVVDRAPVIVHSGSRHLYAPGSHDYCFWLERSFYGRTLPDSAERRVLGGAVRFWALPRDLDTWFSPNPEPAEADQRSSGGALLALRQARCSVAPSDVRESSR